MQNHKSPYHQVLIFYFSGTGNAKAASRWIAGKASEMQIKTTVFNIEKITAKKVAIPVKKSLIGFCGPTHGFNLPPLLLSFIWKFPCSNKHEVFILNTRAGMKLHKLFTPGLSGAAQIFPALILRSKGYKIKGMQPLDLPSNWIFLHPGLKPKVIESIFKRCKKITENFAVSILKGKSNYKALLSLPFDILILPVTVLYYLIGRFFLSKTLIASNKCDLCQVCIKSCPVSAIKIVNKRPFWTYHCESCMKCLNSCHQQAIHTAHGLSIASIWLGFGWLNALVLTIFFDANYLNITNQNFTGKLFNEFLQFIIPLIPVYLLYFLFHFLKKISLIDKLLIYTCLTRYKFWRRYKAPKNFN